MRMRILSNLVVTPAEAIRLASRGEAHILDASWYLPVHGRDPVSEFLERRAAGATFLDLDAASAPADDPTSCAPHGFPTRRRLAMALASSFLTRHTRLPDFPSVVPAPEGNNNNNNNEDGGVESVEKSIREVAPGELDYDPPRFILYDNMGVFSCARTAWTLRALGARAAVFGGGAEAFERNGGEIEKGADQIKTVKPTPDVVGRVTEEQALAWVFGPNHRDLEPESEVCKRVLAGLDDVVSASSSAAPTADIPGNDPQVHASPSSPSTSQTAPQLVDARERDRFEGRGAERPGLRHGHIPGAFNLPHSSVLDPQNGFFLTGAPLRALIDGTGIDTTRPVIVSCGSGVSACVAAAALELSGMDTSLIRIYDGSWVEYGAREDLPIETGPRKEKE